MSCGCRQKGIRAFIRAKVGRCPRCMRLAALGTAVGVCAAAVAYGLYRGLAVPVLVLAAPFAVLLAAHAAVFLHAARRARATPPAEGVALDRRAFVGLGAAAFVAVLLGAPLPAWAGGNPGNCKYDKVNDKCNPSDCGKIYDDSGKLTTRVKCTKLTVDGTTDCYCIDLGADTCKDGNGDCKESKKCPKFYEDARKVNQLTVKCVKSGSVCYCAYTKK